MNAKSQTKLNTVHTTDGVELFVRDWGEGRPILFLSSWGLCSDSWGDVMVDLNALGLRTIAYDRRGHGRSSDPGQLNYDLLADDLEAVLSALDLRDVTVVTHSGASGELLRHAARHGSARIARGILACATAPGIKRTERNPNGVDPALMYATLAQIRDDLPRWLDENLAPFGADALSAWTTRWLVQIVYTTSRRALLDFQREIIDTDFRDELLRFERPLTFIHGDRDASCPIELTAYEAKRMVPHAELVLYRDAPHGLIFTHRKRFVEDIRARCR